jgi:hypothetical protein
MQEVPGARKLKVENMKKGKGESSAALWGKSNYLSQKRKGNRASHQQFLRKE